MKPDPTPSGGKLDRPDRSAFLKLSPGGFPALLEPVSIEALRAIVKNGELGSALHRRYFKSFRAERIERKDAVWFFEQAVKGMDRDDLVQALLDAWLSAVPEAAQFSRELLNRDNPFHGPVSEEFYQRLAAIISERCLAALKEFWPPTESAPSDGMLALRVPRPIQITSAPEPDDQSTDSRPTATLGPETSALSTPRTEQGTTRPYDDLSRLFRSTPSTFDTVVSRDEWLWNNMEIPLLSGDDLNARLPALPDPALGSDQHMLNRAKYAVSVAHSLEERHRWPEAQAYWLAAGYLMTKASQWTNPVLQATLLGIVRTAAAAARLPLPSETPDFETIVTAGILSPSTPGRDATIQALLLAGTIDNSVYEHAGLSGSARAKMGMALPAALPFLQQRLTGLAGTHEMYGIVLSEYTRRLRDLTQAIDVLTHNLTIQFLRTNREPLLKSISDYLPFAFDYDRPLLQAAHRLLGEMLSSCTRSESDVDPASFTQFVRSAENIIDVSRTTGSHVAACLLAPLALSVGSAVFAHYHGLVQQKVPDLTIRLVKPQVAAHEATYQLDVEIANTGTSSAEHSTLYLTVEGTPDVTITPEELYFGRIAPDEAQTRHSKITWSSPGQILELPFTLEYYDRSELRRREGVLRVQRQRIIDWQELETVPPPYQIQSVTDPAKLKGRQRQVNELLVGFQGRNSFLVTGQKRVGKTSLVRVVLTELANVSNALPLYVPIGELSVAGSGNALGRLGWELTQLIVEEYESRFDTPAGVSVPPIDDFDASFGNAFSRFLRQFTRAHPEIRVAFALDDFDELPTPLFTGETGQKLFLALRALIDKGFSFFFVGSERLPGIIRDQSERLNQVKPLRVDYLDRDGLSELVRDPTRDILEFGDDAIREIHQWSDGNPYFAILICSKIWSKALRDQDYWIAARDVDSAVSELVNETDRSSYQHFWSDSPRTEDSERLVYRTKSSLVLSALSRVQTDSMIYLARQAIGRHTNGLTTEEAERHIQELIQRNVLEHSPDNAEFVRIRVPLFALWLKRRGAIELEQDGPRGTQPLFEILNREVSAQEVVPLSQGLLFRGRPISVDHIRLWAAQFGALDRQRLMLKLLPGVRRHLFDSGRFQDALSELHSIATARARSAGVLLSPDSSGRLGNRNWYATHVDPDGKSGSATLYQYRAINRVAEPCCGSPERVISAIAGSSGKVVLVCVDDFIGTGRSAAEGLQERILVSAQ